MFLLMIISLSSLSHWNIGENSQEPRLIDVKLWCKIPIKMAVRICEQNVFYKMIFKLSNLPLLQETENPTNQKYLSAFSPFTPLWPKPVCCTNVQNTPDQFLIISYHSLTLWGWYFNIFNRVGFLLKMHLKEFQHHGLWPQRSIKAQK